MFTGEVVGDTASEWKISQSNQTFRSVVYRGEMQPDQWPKYKYLLMEIWKPSHQALKTEVEVERKRCRGEVFSALHNSYLTAYCRENRKLEDQLDRTEQTQIFNQAFDAYNGLLRNLGASALDRDEMKTAIATVPATASTEPEEEPETWNDIGNGIDRSS